MKKEKTSKEKPTAIDTERRHFNNPISEAELEDTKNKLLLSFKKMIDQGVARPDFEKDKTGEIESVTITRVLTG